MKKTYIITKVVKKKHDSSRPDLRSFKSCMIKECPNSTLDNSKTFIPFPNCQDAFERWSPFIKTPNLGIYSKIFICSDHFKVEVRKCVMSMLKEIKEGALPIISGSIIDPDPWVKIDSVRSCNPAEIDEPGKSSLHDDVDMTIVKQEQDVQETAIDPPDQQPESSLLNEKDDGVKSSTEASVSQPVGFRLKVKDLRSLQESPQKVLDSTDSTSFNEEPGVEKVLKKRRRCAGKIVINQASEPVCVSKNVTRLRNVNHVKKKKRKKVLWVYKDDMDELGYDDIPTKRGKTRKRNRRKKKQVSNEVNMRKIETMASERYADNITSYMRKNIHGVVPCRTEDKIFSWLSTGRRGKRRLKKPTRPVCKPKTSVIEQLCKNENHTSSHDVILDEACNDELEGSEELINYEKSINLIPSGSVLTSTEDSDMHQVILVEKDGQWNFFDENKDEFNTFYDDTEDEHNYAIRSNVRPSETNTSLDNECSETDTDKEPEDQIGTECPVDLNSSNKDDSQVGSKCQSFDEHNYFKTWQNKGTKMKFCSTCNSILRHNKCYKWFKHLSCSQFSFECSNCTLRTDSADFLVTHMIVHHGLEVFNMRVVTKMKNGKKYVHRGINEVVEGADPKFAVKKHNVNLAFLMDKLRYGATISRECTGDRNIAGHLYHLKNMLFVLSEYSIRRIAFEYISRYHPFEIVKCVDSVRMVDIVWYRNFIRKYPAVLEGNAPMFSSLKHETDVFFDRFIELCRKLSLSRNSVYTVDFTTVFVSDELPTVSTGRQRSVQTNVEKVSLLCGVRGDGAFTTTLITSSFPLSSDSSEVVIDSGPTDGKIDSGSFAMFIHSFLRKVKPMERVLLLVDGSKYYTQSFEIYENLMAKGVTILSIPGNLLSLNPLRNCIFPAIVSRMQAVINKRIKKFGKANVSDFVSVFEEACKTNGQEKDLSSLVVQAYAAFGIIPFNKQGTLNKLMSKRSKSDRGYLLNFRPIKEKISDLVLNCIVPINSPPEGLKRKRTNTRRFNILKRQSKVVKKSLQKKLENPVGKGVRRDVQKDARTDRRKNNKSAPVSKQTNTTVIDEPCQEDLLEDAPKVKEEISDDVVGELMDIIVKEDSKQPKAGRRSVDPRKGKKKCLICKKMHATESKMFVCDSCRV
ncbi:uncharacterized protein LOC106662998 isoform X3 [Cimex lectularius]|uniref:THAP-type domain-containing protein n=1 Tax=Cimex lectularius TaxID=79782 RepID=A0A8I6SKC9_CIMLE|nr:uncharacterized protein LOC106662998 isoform X3 [Cimex lectularius]